MDVNAVAGRLYEQAADTIVVFGAEGGELAGVAQAVDEALSGALRELIEGGDFSGKSGQVAVLYPRGAIPAKRVIAVGLGQRDRLTVDTLRRAAAQAAQKARDLKARTMAAAPEVIDGLDIAQAAEALAEGALLGLYQYHGQKTSDAPEALPELFTIVVEGRDLEAAQPGVAAGAAIAAGVNLTRDLVNLPPNICTPAYLAETAQRVGAQVGLKVEVLERRQMESLGMGALLGVAQGSETPPRFIIMEHNADKAGELDTIVLVGKAVTFDTGGYSLKSGEGMAGMKADMGGGGAVIGAMQVIGTLRISLHVVGLIPAVDNMVSGKAYRPQDVLRASNGVTIEIISTDAEGRLLLADALAFASRYKPAAVVDIATLTGACVVALGTVAAGLFSSDDNLRDALLHSAEQTGEKVWPLPLWPEYDKAIESQTADVKNSGGRYGGAATAAAFLTHFVDYPAWAHLDIAGVAGIEGMNSNNDNPYVPGKGATGFGVRLMTDFARRWSPVE
ncbi:MAG TPA: leucyl aminopeptidase [Spirillospora sp.]|nr:leucyl aminopeptidase [Spirillospora sp.]